MSSGLGSGSAEEYLGYLLPASSPTLLLQHLTFPFGNHVFAFLSLWSGARRARTSQGESLGLLQGRDPDQSWPMSCFGVGLLLEKEPLSELCVVKLRE